MVGQRFLEQLVSRMSSDTVDLTVFCEEPRAAYDRVQLTSFFAGKSAIDLNVVPARFFEDKAITLRLNDRVVAIDRRRKIVRSGRYREVPYDKLVLATGSYPFVPPIPGRDRRGCFVYRTIEDLEVIAAAARRARVGMVIGGGLLGLEAAKALKDLGLETHVVEFAPRLMAVQLDDAGGRLLRRKIEALGVAVHTCEEHHGNRRRRRARAHRMVFADGSRARDRRRRVFPPASGRATSSRALAELAVGARGGIVIDDALPHLRSGHLRHRRMRARGTAASSAWSRRATRWREVAARHLAGEADAKFRGADMSTKLKLMGVDVASIGDAHRHDARRARLRLHRRARPASTRSWWCRATASSCSARCWSATPPTTARCCR